MNTDAPRVHKQRRSSRNTDSAPRQGSAGIEKGSRDAFDLPKKREMLPRCSYRRNVKELPSDVPMVQIVAENILDEVHVSPTAQVPTFYNSNTGQFRAPEAGPAIFQYTGQCEDHSQHYYVPASKVVVQAATGDMSAYQIHSPISRLPQGITMASSPGSLHSPQQLTEEVSRKRELRLMKNREAARECRRKKKEYVKCLENRVAVLENQNKMLIEELRTLKDLEAAKECRRRKRDYVRCLEVRLAMLEVQNKKLINELDNLKKMHSGKSY